MIESEEKTSEVQKLDDLKEDKDSGKIALLSILGGPNKFSKPALSAGGPAQFFISGHGQTLTSSRSRSFK